MAFTGKATYSSFDANRFSELAEDVSDIISVVSPYETPLLDHLGDAPRPAASTYHEWLEDELLPNTDAINDNTWTNPAADQTFGVDHASRFRVGDQIRAEGSTELMLVTDVSTANGTITVERGYGGTTAANLADNLVLRILGNAALEGDDAPGVRFSNRSRRGNWTQIFNASVRVSGSDLAVRKLAVGDELDFQKQERLRELLRDLEATVINGAAPAANAQGAASVRRTMRGILPALTTNVFKADVDVGSHVYRDLMGVYESDFGVCRVVLSRSVPADGVLLLDSSRLAVLPLAGRSFHYKPLASTGDFETGEVLGEYTLELRNENAHGVIRGLKTA